MRIILLKDVAGVGRRDTVVEANDGYAQNFLIPRGLAAQATPASIAEIEKRIAQEKELDAKRLARVSEKLARLQGKRITLKVRANEKGHLFKSINAKEIIVAIQQEIGEIFPEQSLKRNALPLRGVGEHPIHIETAEAKANLTLVIEAA